MLSGREAVPVGDAFSYIRKGMADAKGSCREAWGKDHDRYLFAGVVGAAPGRIVAVIGGEHHEVGGLEPADQFGKARIEGFERLREALLHRERPIEEIEEA